MYKKVKFMLLRLLIRLGIQGKATKKGERRLSQWMKDQGIGA